MIETDRRPVIEGIRFTVAERAFPYALAQEVRREQNNICQGIDDRNGLSLCVFQVAGINGRFQPASRQLGFNIDISHYSHNKNSDIYYSKEGVRCQCLACHMLYTQSIGHFSSVKKINKRYVYHSEAINPLNREKFKQLDVSLRYPKDALDALTESLFKYGVRWEHGRDVVVPDPWLGPGNVDQIYEIARRVYAPSKDTAYLWESGLR